MTTTNETVAIFSYNEADLLATFEDQIETLPAACNEIAEGWGVVFLPGARIAIPHSKIADFRAACDEIAGGACDDENDLLMACLAGESLKPV